MRKIKVLFLVLSMSLCIVGCVKSDEEKIIGSWNLIKMDGESSVDNYELTFFEDGSVVVEKSGYSSEANYAFADHKIRIYSSSGLYGESSVTDYKLDDNILILYDFGGVECEFEKIE